MKASIHIGTSGWSYESWKGSFYPENIAGTVMLQAYCKVFETVEINNTFYNMPSEKAVRGWHEVTPKQFLFAVKASRFITHQKKLKDPESSIHKFFQRVELLDDKLGPILFQLPPRWKANPERLKGLLDVLPHAHRYTFEFRDQSWLCDPVYDILQRHNVNLCFYDFRLFQPPEIVTGDFIYLRLHGPKRQAYSGSYSLAALGNYAEKIKRWRKQGHDVYCYFDNDQKACAPQDARSLLKRL